MIIIIIQQIRLQLYTYSKKAMKNVGLNYNNGNPFDISDIKEGSIPFVYYSYLNMKLKNKESKKKKKQYV